MNPKTASLIQLNIAVLLWGGTAMFAKGIDLPAYQIICFRSLVAAVALVLFILAMRTSLRLRQRSHWGIMALLGVLLCLHWVTYFHALKVSTAAVTLLSLHTYPVFTALVEPLVFREKFRKSDILVAVIVFAGVLIMVPQVSLSNTTTQGILLGVVSGLFFMARNLLTRKYVQHYTSSSLMFFQVTVTGLVLLPFVFLAGDAAVPPSRTIGLLVLLGIVFTALPQTLFSASFRHLSARTGGILATLLPFYGAILGYLLYHEVIPARTAIGGLLILGCVVFETTRQVRRA